MIQVDAQAAFFTRPARMQAAQTRMCLLTPPITARTRRKFGFHRRRRVLFAWLITFPKCGTLPHNSHFIAINLPSILPKIRQMRAFHSTRRRPLFPLRRPPAHLAREIAKYPSQEHLARSASR
jgi:hypothetical protein